MKHIKLNDGLYARLTAKRDELAKIRGSATYGDVVADGLNGIASIDVEDAVAKAAEAVDAMQDATAQAVVALAQALAVPMVLAHRRIEGVLTPAAAWGQLPPMLRRECISQAFDAMPRIEDVPTWAAIANRAYAIGHAQNIEGDGDDQWSAPVYDVDGNRLADRPALRRREEPTDQPTED